MSNCRCYKDIQHVVQHEKSGKVSKAGQDGERLDVCQAWLGCGYVDNLIRSC